MAGAPTYNKGQGKSALVELENQAIENKAEEI
jgi:hypothetical protein